MFEGNLNQIIRELKSMNNVTGEYLDELIESLTSIEFDLDDVINDLDLLHDASEVAKLREISGGY